MIQIYNSLSRKKERIPRIKKLRLFVCGPTVYDDAHIGHARTYIFFDFFAKYLRSLGHDVKYVQNITDIDDKIIRRASEEKKDPLKLADYFTKRYFADMKALGVNSVNVYAPATKFIPQIVKQVQNLIKNGYAYEIPGDGWYYDISRFRNYGKLSGRTVEGAEDAISRIDESVRKRNKGDFCLWKFSKPGEPSWKSPPGDGRPGWHIEDTAISEHYFGPQYEIHGGGLDLKFPHHEAEIAQQEAASGKNPFVKMWMHTGMVTVGGQKMSKSLGNFIAISDYLKNHSPEALRLAFFGCHYRSPADYNDKLIENAERALSGLKEFSAKLDFIQKSKVGSEQIADISIYEKHFTNALQDDINTPEALASVFRLASDLNPKIWTLSKKSAGAAQKHLKTALGALGIGLRLPKTPKKISDLARTREKLRSNKQFIQSDALRKKIDGLGYLIEDTPIGPFVWSKHQN